MLLTGRRRRRRLFAGEQRCDTAPATILPILNADQRERIAWRRCSALALTWRGRGDGDQLDTGPALTSATVPLAYAFDDGDRHADGDGRSAKTVFTLVGGRGGRGPGRSRCSIIWTIRLVSTRRETYRGQSRSQLQCDGDGRGRRCGDSGAVGQCRRRHADAWHGRDDCC